MWCEGGIQAYMCMLRTTCPMPPCKRSSLHEYLSPTASETFKIVGPYLTLNIPRGVLRGPPLVCYWLTSVEINKHKIFDTNNA